VWRQNRLTCARFERGAFERSRPLPVTSVCGRLPTVGIMVGAMFLRCISVERTCLASAIVFVRPAWGGSHSYRRLGVDTTFHRTEDGMGVEENTFLLSGLVKPSRLFSSIVSYVYFLSPTRSSSVVMMFPISIFGKQIRCGQRLKFRMQSSRLKASEGRGLRLANETERW
jgi:hypothetical protein